MEKIKNQNMIENSKTVGISLTFKIITLKIIGLNNPIKRQWLTEWIKHRMQLYNFFKRHTLDSNIK